jgi:hypothetical protein
VGARRCLAGGAKPTTQTHAARSCAALMAGRLQSRRAAIAAELVARQLQRQRRSQCARRQACVWRNIWPSISRCH